MRTGPIQVPRNWPICWRLGIAPTRYPVLKSSIRSVACDMAMHVAAPTMTDETMAALSPRPLVITMRIVTAIRVIPLMGDQFVRPMHSDRITPAIQIQIVPSTAMMIPRPRPISSTDETATNPRTMTAPAMQT